MPVDPTSINTTISNSIFSNTTGKITAASLLAVLNAIIAWMILNFASADLGLDPAARASHAEQSFIARFWTGTQTGGHLAINNGNTLGPAANPPTEYSAIKPILWQYAAGWTVPYSYWRVTGGVPASPGVSASGGNPDALARLGAVKAWVAGNWSASDLAVCNNGTPGSQSATTVDDAAWVVRGLVELYEATGDTAMLTDAKALIDCMNGGAAGFFDGALMSGGQSHWYDATPVSSITWASTGGGTLTITTSRTMAIPVTPTKYFNIAGHANSAVNTTFQAATVSGNVITVTGVSNPGSLSGGAWYHSGFGKGMDSVSFALAELYYYSAACPVEGGSCPTSLAYYNSAKTEIDWANATLDRSVNANCVQTDHLFWSGVSYGTPPVPLDVNGPLCSRANVIALGGSVVGLAENMGAAIANKLLYSITNTPTYLAQSQNIAGSILSRELDTCGAFLDDRDARIAGFAAYDFAAKVMPSLSSGTAASIKAAYLATSLATVQKNTTITGTFGGDFCGPWQGVWTAAGFHPDQLEISAQAAIIAITAAGL